MDVKIKCILFSTDFPVELNELTYNLKHINHMKQNRLVITVLSRQRQRTKNLKLPKLQQDYLGFITGLSNKYLRFKAPREYT